MIYHPTDFPSGLGPKPLDALRKKRIVAFAGAATILPGMREVSDSATMYLERQDQFSHSVMFVRGAVDAVVADELIFAHYTREFLGPGRFAEFAATAVFDPAFCLTSYHLVFRNDELRNTFNNGLSVIRADGALEQIEEKYATGAGLTKVPRRNEGC